MGSAPTDPSDKGGPGQEWLLAEPWFHRLASLDGAARSAMLERVRAEHPALGRDLETLIEAHDRLSVLDRAPGRLREALYRVRREARAGRVPAEPPSA